jgi:hypothetical protein
MAMQALIELPLRKHFIPDKRFECQNLHDISDCVLASNLLLLDVVVSVDLCKHLGCHEARVAKQNLGEGPVDADREDTKYQSLNNGTESLTFLYKNGYVLEEVNVRNIPSQADCKQTGYRHDEVPFEIGAETCHRY